MKLAKTINKSEYLSVNLSTSLSRPAIPTAAHATALLCSVVTDHHTFTAAGSAYLFAVVVRCFAKYYAMQ